MTVNFSLLVGIPLFSGFKENEIAELLVGCDYRVMTYRNKQRILTQGEPINDICIVYSGSVLAYMEEIDGRLNIVNQFGVGEIFGDVMALSMNKNSLISIDANSDMTSVIMLPYSVLLRHELPLTMRLLKNLTAEVSRKYFQLHRRINCLTRQSLREKILLFLTYARNESDSDTFSIPFDRESLAAYLNADRSALSRELSALRREGLITFKKNTFSIKGQI